MQNERIQPRSPKGAMKSAKAFARISDMVLTVVFAYLAFRLRDEGGFWFWFWIASSAFCAVAVVRSPIDMMWNLAAGRVYGQRKA